MGFKCNQHQNCAIFSTDNTHKHRYIERERTRGRENKDDNIHKKRSSLKVKKVKMKNHKLIKSYETFHHIFKNSYSCLI